MALGGDTDPGSLAGRISELTRITRRVERRLRQLRVVAIASVTAVIAVVVGGGLLLANASADRDQLHRIIDGDCQAFAAIGTLDVPPTAAPVLHRIIDSQRGAYNRRCVDVDGPLPPVRTVTPSPSPSR
jgi:hypothetical protein